MRNTVQSCRQQDKDENAHAALLALAPKNFTISLSSYYNYTQSYKKGTFQAKRHHKGRGVNACISLHQAPDTAPIKDLIINIHWTSANVNYMVDEAAESPENFCVESKDAKKIVRPNSKFGGKMWNQKEYPDHTNDQSWTNAVTPITHLFVRTVETNRCVSVNCDDSIQELGFSTKGREETVIHLKRTGNAVSVLNLSHYEPETILRHVNEFSYLLTLPSLDHFFRNPATGKLKANIVFVVDNGVEMPRSPAVQMLMVRLQKYLGVEKVVITSFAEYYSEHNPVERVHAVEEKQLQKHGPFNVRDYEIDTAEHRAAMEDFAREVAGVLTQGCFGGKHIEVVRGIGEEENFVFQDEDGLARFLKLNEKRKAESQNQ